MDKPMAERAKPVEFNDKFLRSLSPKKHPGTPPRIFKYDAVVPGLNVMWTPTHLSFGMTKRWPDKKSDKKSQTPTWRKIGDVYLPAKKDDVPKEEITDGALTISEARGKARRWLELLSRGIDPAGEGHRRRIEAAKRIKFETLREAFLKHFEGKKKHGEATRILNKDFACWNGRWADDISDGDVDEAIQVVVVRGKKYQAINAFGYVRAMYNWAMGQPRLNIKTSPCQNLSAKDLIGKKRPRTRVLRDEELRAIWNACDKIGYPYGPIIRLLILTPVRENEIARMSRPELGNLNMLDALLTIPSERMKGDNDEPPPPHEVPLTATMVEIITSLPQFDGPYLFSTTRGEKPVNGWSKAKQRIDKLSGVTGWKFHDLRRTVRTRVSAVPAEEHVREALVAHGRRGIQAHYDQHRYRSEKLALLVAWETKLIAIINPPADVKPPSADVIRFAVAVAS